MTRAWRARLRAAGKRLHAAEHERDLALAELKAALLEVNGDITDEEAASLTEVALAAVHVLKDTDPSGES